MIARILILLVLLGGSAVLADERPPRYDLDGLCSRRANTPDGFSPETMANCLAAQGDSLESVRRIWPNARDYIQRDCDLRAKVDREGDYDILDRCVRAQLRQEEASQAESTRPKAKPKPKVKPAATPPQN